MPYIWYYTNYILHTPTYLTICIPTIYILTSKHHSILAYTYHIPTITQAYTNLHTYLLSSLVVDFYHQYKQWICRKTCWFFFDIVRFPGMHIRKHHSPVDIYDVALLICRSGNRTGDTHPTSIRSGATDEVSRIPSFTICFFACGRCHSARTDRKICKCINEEWLNADMSAKTLCAFNIGCPTLGTLPLKADSLRFKAIDKAIFRPSKQILEGTIPACCGKKFSAKENEHK